MAGRRNLEKELFDAITGNNTAAALALIEGRNVNINAISQQENSRGKSPLCYASELGRLQIVEALLTADPPADINMRMADGTTALSLACEEGSPAVVKSLLSANPPPNVNAQDNNGVTPLMQAAAAGSVECVKLLLSSTPPADPTIQSRDGNIARIYAKSQLDPRNFEIEVLLWEATEAPTRVATRRLRDRPMLHVSNLTLPRMVTRSQARRGGYKRLTRRKTVGRH